MLKPILKYISGIFLVIFVTIAVLSFSLYQFTDYENIKPLASELMENQISAQFDQQQLMIFGAAVKIQCNGTDYVSMPFGDKTIKLKCSEVASADPLTIIKIVSAGVFDQVYNADYDCSGIQCFIENPTFIISSKANSTIFSFFLYALLLSALMGIIVFFMTNNISGKLKAFGLAFISTGIQAAMIFVFRQKIPEDMMVVGGNVVNNLMDILFFNFMVIFIIGLMLFAAGFVIARKETKPAKKRK